MQHVEKSQTYEELDLTHRRIISNVCTTSLTYKCPNTVAISQLISVQWRTISEILSWLGLMSSILVPPPPPPPPVSQRGRTKPQQMWLPLMIFITLAPFQYFIYEQ